MSTIQTRIPARMDRLPWTRWHWRIVFGLGLVWVLDGLEVTIIGSIASRLTEKGSGLELTDFQIGQAAAIYVAGACTGALFFGRLTDRYGRKKLFMVTLGVYLLGTVATAFTGSYLAFAVCRFFTGSGIGGEYAAINSAVDELIPARVRGTVDLLINGSYWLGTAGGAALSLAALDTDLFAKDLGWRLAFGLGAVLGLGVLIVRRSVPESPRWLFIHGRDDEAEATVQTIEREVADASDEPLPEPKGEAITIEQRSAIPFRVVASTLFNDYRRRSVVGFSLFVGQAFLYNAVFFSYGTLLSTFYGVSAGSVPLYIIPFAFGNFLGPLLLGRLFDVVGRKPMIAGSYLVSGAGLLITAFLFKADVLNAITQTIAWCIIFFFASAGTSSAYLTVSEIFPMETRALAIAFFYALGTGVGGITGPLLFGKLIDTGHETPVFWGFVLGAVMMMAGGVVQAIWGVSAEGRGLEDIAKPLTQQSGGGYSPRQHASSRSPEELEVGPEVQTLVEALRREGPLSRSALQQRGRVASWGPGRYRRALANGLATGAIRRRGRHYDA